MSKVFIERVYFYWRQSMYGHIHALCQQFQKTQGNDPLYIIWDALAFGAIGKTSTALEVLDKIKNRIASGLAISYAKLWIHNSAKNKDYTSLNEIEKEIEKLVSGANTMAVVQAAQVLWLTGDTETAFQLVHPLTSQSPPNKEATALVGWIKLTEGDTVCNKWFEMAMSDAGSPEPTVLYGRALFFAKTNRWQDSLSAFVQLAGICDFPEASLERARIYIQSGSFDLGIEAAQEGSGKYVSDADMLLLQIFQELSQTGNLEGARGSVKTMVNLIQQLEIDNHSYIAKVASFIFALSWSDKSIVGSLLGLFGRFANRNIDNADFLTVYGKLLIANERAQDALEILQSAVVNSPDSVFPGAALVDAYIRLNQMNDAQSQLDFVQTIPSTPDSNLIVQTLIQKISRMNDIPCSIDSLISAMSAHLDSVQQFFIPAFEKDEKKLNIDGFMDRIPRLRLSEFSMALDEAMMHCNTLDRTVGDPRNGPVCDVIIRMLDFLPGSVPFSYYLAVLGFGEKRYSQAMKAIQFVLTSRWGFNASQCHLLLAQIKLRLKQFDEVENSINRAVSHDFGIRSTLRYNMIHAQLEEARGHYDEAIKAARGLTKTVEYIQAPSSERINTLLFIAKTQKHAGKMNDAIETINEALTQFSGKSEEGTIKLFQASLFAKMGNINEALMILDTFEIDSQLFTMAKKKAAKIHLNLQKDKNAYIKCFRQLCEASPTKQNKLLLGDALMKVKKFDEAVDYLSDAFEDDTSDTEIAIHLARSLMIVHQYEMACDVYHRAIDISDNDPAIVYEYALSLFKLRRFEDSMNLAKLSLGTIPLEGGEWENQYYYARLSDLLGVIDQKFSDGKDSVEYFNQSLQLYDKLTATRNDIPHDKIKMIRKTAVEEFVKAADMHIAEDEIDKAIRRLERASEIEDGSSTALIHLARLYSDTGKIDEAKECCQKILRQDTKCEEAAIILADLTAQESIEELEKTYQENPTFYKTLVRLVELCARSGQLDRVNQHIQNANYEHAGAVFCRGLYEYYMGFPQRALKLFFQCRNDSEWGINAQVYSFHIYANPSRKFVWCETRPLGSNSELQSAEKILKRLENTGVDTTQLEASLLLSRNTTETITKALEIFQSCNGDDLNITLGKCRCWMRLDQQKDVTRNLNSIIHSVPTTSENACFVEAYLMITQISLKDDSLNEAREYVEKAIELDKSCVKAWEMAAQISEKQKDWASSAFYLEKAWNLTGKNDCNIGYRLCLSYMKAQSPVNAIKVASSVLSRHPNYPKIKEQILIPCCDLIRT